MGSIRSLLLFGGVVGGDIYPLPLLLYICICLCVCVYVYVIVCICLYPFILGCIAVLSPFEVLPYHT